MAVRVISTKLAIDGEQEYRDKMRGVNDELKTLGTELRLVESEFKGQANSIEALTAKGGALQNLYDKQADKVKELAGALQNAQSAQAAYIQRVESAKTALDSAEAGMDRLKNSSGDTEAAQKKLADEINRLGNELDEAAAHEAAAARGVNDWQRQLNTAKTTLNNLDNELKQNTQYLNEADRAADKCATSIDRYGKEAKQAATATGDAAEKGGLLQKIFAGGFLANIATQALSGIVRMFKDMATAGIKLASDLSEVQNVVDTTFGDDAAKIETWAAKASKAFGLSELNAKQFTSTLGAMMKSSGIVGDDLTKMSTDLAGVAADFGSFYNLDVETAFDKIRQAIGGETEGLKQLGINLSVANLMQTDYAKGLNKSWTEMTAAEQTMTRYNAILALGSDALGDFTKTSDSYANQLKVMQLEVDNVKTALGEKLLPIAADVVSALSLVFSAPTTAAEKMDSLLSGIGEGDNTLALIENYRQLQEELANTGLSEAEVSEKTEKLSEVKERLIATSNGVVTALGEETGTFDDQVAALEGLTKAQQELEKQRLIAEALANTGEAAEKRRADALIESQRLNDEYIASLQRLNSVETGGGLGKFFDDIALFDPQLKSAAESAGELQKKTEDASAAIAQMDADSATGRAALESLVEIYGSADLAAEAMGITVDDLNNRLGATTSAVKDLAEAEEAAAVVLNDFAQSIDVLQTSYNEMYAAASDAINGTIGLWDEMDSSAIKTAEEVKTALESQINWLYKYDTDLTALENRKISGVDLTPLLTSLADGTEESAAILAGLRIATDGEIRQIVESFNRVGENKSNLASSMAEVKTEFLKNIDAMTQEAITKMALSDQAGAAANDTMQGYIDGIYDKKDAVIQAFRDVAEAALKEGHDKTMDRHSPSRVMQRAAKDDWDGYILESKRKQQEMKAVFSETMTKANKAAQTALPSSVDIPRSSAGASAAQIGDVISKSLSAVGGSGESKTITINLTAVSQLDGRQIAKSTYKYNIEESSLQGENLIE